MYNSLMMLSNWFVRIFRTKHIKFWLGVELTFIQIHQYNKNRLKEHANAPLYTCALDFGQNRVHVYICLRIPWLRNPLLLLLPSYHNTLLSVWEQWQPWPSFCFWKFYVYFAQRFIMRWNDIRYAAHIHTYKATITILYEDFATASFLVELQSPHHLDWLREGKKRRTKAISVKTKDICTLNNGQS